MNWNIRELETQWNPEYIARDCQYGLREIERITDYIKTADMRMDYLNTLNYLHVVECNRYKYGSSPVHYIVTVYKYPDISNGKQTRIYLGETFRFSGRERKQARECAKEQAEKYNCEIEGNVMNND